MRRIPPFPVTVCLALISLSPLPAQLIPRKPAPAPAAPSSPVTPPATPAAPSGPVVPPVPGRPLKDEDMDRLLRQLAEIEAALQGKRSSYNNSLLAQLKEAANSEEKSFQLWLDGTKEFDFDENGKTATEFAEWKRTKGKELHNPAFMTGLRLQVRYLSVLIVYSNALTDAAKGEAITAAVAYLEDLASSARKLNGQMEPLNGNALEGVIARHLKLDTSIPKSKNDASRPGNVHEIYEKAIFPYYREKGQTASLLAAWQKLINQETVMVEAGKVPEKVETFTKERLPVLKWGMAREMYDAGQEDTGMAAMLGLIKGNLGIRQTSGWISEMTELLRDKKERAEAGIPTPGIPASRTPAAGSVPGPAAARNTAPAPTPAPAPVLNPFENSESGDGTDTAPPALNPAPPAGK
ncbi:MAG: hypothetical protein V4726_15745 [Verrucomicrobiota bacterium]